MISLSIKSDTIEKLAAEGKVVSMVVDCVFKTIIRHQSLRGYTIDIISGITNLDKDFLEQNLVFKNTEIGKNHVLEKGRNSDVIASIENNVVVLEMNSSHYPGLFEKNLSYATGIQSEMLRVGESYAEQKMIYLINFDFFKQFGDEVFTNFMMRSEDDKYVETKNFKSFHVNLANLMTKYYNKDSLTELENRLLLLCIDNIDELDKIVGDDENMKKTVDKLKNLSSDPEFIGLYDVEERRKYELNCRVNHAKKQGIEETARNLKNLGIDYETISKATSLSLEEIEKL